MLTLPLHCTECPAARKAEGAVLMVERVGERQGGMHSPPRGGEQGLGADTGAGTSLQKHKGRLIKHQTLTESRALNKPSARHMDVLIGFNNVIHSFRSKHTHTHFAAKDLGGAGRQLQSLLGQGLKPEEQLLFQQRFWDKYFKTFPSSV